MNTIVVLPWFTPDAGVRTWWSHQTERKVKQLFSAKTGRVFGFIGTDTQHIAPLFQLIHVLSRKPQCTAVQPKSWLSGRDRTRAAAESVKLAILRQSAINFDCDITRLQWFHYLTPSIIMVGNGGDVNTTLVH